jgi:DNA-binding response OmpR family regulator
MKKRGNLHPSLPEFEPAERSRRILLAEDDAAMRALLARTLRRAGFDVVEARSGHETLDRLSQGLDVELPIGFDLIISDVHMPGYDGLNILASIRQAPIRVPVILITAFGTAAAHATAGRLGAFAILDKPFDLDDLMALVKAAISRTET